MHSIVFWSAKPAKKLHRKAERTVCQICLIVIYEIYRKLCRYLNIMLFVDLKNEVMNVPVWLPKRSGESMHWWNLPTVLNAALILLGFWLTDQVILLRCLEVSFGIKERALYWMKSCVCKGFQCVSVGGRSSPGIVYRSKNDYLYT